MTLKTRQALREVTKQLVVIHGESGTGKTFVAIDMAFSFMYGQPFLSHFKPSEPSRVVYVSHDNVSGLKGGGCNRVDN